MESIVQLLPKLSNTSITIADRLANIYRMDIIISNRSSAQSWNLQRHYRIIESVRVLIMSLEYPYDLGANLATTLTYNFRNSTFTQSEADALIIDQYLDERIELEYIIDIINYYNKVCVNNICEKIDIDYLLKCNTHYILYNNMDAIVAVHKLIDGMSNGKYVRNSAVGKIINNHLIIDGVPSKFKISQRDKYASELTKLTNTCLIDEIPLVMDNIRIEKCRIHYMALHKDTSPEEKAELQDPYLKFIDDSDLLMEIIYYMDNSYELCENLYSCIVDMVRFNNYLVTNRLYAQNDIQPYVDMAYIAKNWIGSNTDIINHLKAHFRIDVINGILK